jgi:hypothetical protein
MGELEGFQSTHFYGDNGWVRKVPFCQFHILHLMHVGSYSQKLYQALHRSQAGGDSKQPNARLTYANHISDVKYQEN